MRKLKDLALELEKTRGPGPGARENSRIWPASTRKLENLSREREKTRGSGPRARENASTRPASTRKFKDLAREPQEAQIQPEFEASCRRLNSNDGNTLVTGGGALCLGNGSVEKTQGLGHRGDKFSQNLINAICVNQVSHGTIECY